MHTYDVVLFIHLAFVIATFGLAFILMATGARVARATELRELRAATLVGKRIGPIMPLGALGIFGSGAYLASEFFSFSDAWVIAAICGLVVMELLGGGVAGRHMASLGQRAAALGDGPIPPDLASDQHQLVPAAAENVTMALGFGIVFLMATKPGTAGTAATLLIAVAVGLAGTLALVRRPVQAHAVTETA